MKNKKGFTLMETIVMILFLAVALLMIYRSFTGAIETEKIRRKFDNTLYLYRTNVVINYLKDNGINTYLNDASLTNNYKVIECNTTGITNQEHCTFLKNTFEIEKMYLMKYQIPNTIDYSKLLPSLVDYVRTLDYKGEGYRLIIKFNNDEYASLKVTYE